MFGAIKGKSEAGAGQFIHEKAACLPVGSPWGDHSEPQPQQPMLTTLTPLAPFHSICHILFVFFHFA